MKRILALASMYSTEERKSNFPIISEQVKVFSKRSKITLIHMHRDENLSKLLELNFKAVNENLEEIEVCYRAKEPKTYFSKINATMEQNRIARMVCKALLDEREFDQIHIHYSWPFITLGRELNLRYKLPLFLFTYDIDYRYLEYRKTARTSLSSRLLTLFSIQNVKKIFSPTPALLKRISRNYRIGSKIDMLPFSVNNSIYELNGIPKQKKIFLSLNLFSVEKYPNLVDDLNNFLKHHPNYNLSISIDEQDQEKLKTYLSELDQSRFKYFVNSDTHTKSQELNSANIAVILNETNFDPSIFNQASCSGCAILCDKEVSFSFMIDASNGMVVRKGNPLVEALSEMSKIEYDYPEISKAGIQNFGEDYIANSYHNEIKYY